jgi:hypothetical protein
MDDFTDASIVAELLFPRTIALVQEQGKKEKEE